MENQKDDEEAGNAVFAELKYQVAVKAADGKWYVCAGFTLESAARAYEMTLRSSGVNARAIW